MKRNQIDKLISYTGLVIAVVLTLLAGTLLYAQNFIHDQVKGELSAQKIVFPEKDSDALKNLDIKDREPMERYAGQTMTTGKQAQTYANHYINAHLQHIGGGKTYAQLSQESMASPDDQSLKSKVETVFKGETLRGMLLNAYAFDTMGVVAGYAAFGSIAAAVILSVLALLGFSHAEAVAPKNRKRR